MKQITNKNIISIDLINLFILGGFIPRLNIC